MKTYVLRFAKEFDSSKCPECGQVHSLTLNRLYVFPEGESATLCNACAVSKSNALAGIAIAFNAVLNRAAAEARTVAQEEIDRYEHTK